MKFLKVISGIFALGAVAAVVLTLGVTARALNSSPKILEVPADAAEKVVGLMDAVSDGDYARASGCLLGNPSLGVDREPDSDVGKAVWNAFTDSFTYTLEGDLYATDTGLAQNVRVSFLELDSITTGLNERAQELLKQRVEEADRLQDVYDETYGYRSEVINEVLLQDVEEALQTRAQTTAVELTLNLVYQDDHWWVSPANDLLNAISGNILY